MKEMISKAILSGLGLASMTREAIMETANDLVKRSKLSEAEGRRLVKQFQHRSAQVQKAFEKKVESAVHDALKHLEPASLHPKKKPKGKRRGSTSRSAKRAAKH